VHDDRDGDRHIQDDEEERDDSGYDIEQQAVEDRVLPKRHLKRQVAEP
jgi:hypothetical protein